MRLWLAIIILSASFVACASTSNTDKYSRNVELDSNSMQMYHELDDELDALETETNSISDDYEKIEKTVIARIKFNDTAADENAPIKAEINANNVLLINGNALSKNDFIEYAKRNLPAKCAVTPEITLMPGASYDTAAWVLEVFYENGCTNVTINN